MVENIMTKEIENINIILQVLKQFSSVVILNRREFITDWLEAKKEVDKAFNKLNLEW